MSSEAEIDAHLATCEECREALRAACHCVLGSGDTCPFCDVLGDGEERIVAQHHDGSQTDG